MNDMPPKTEPIVIVRKQTENEEYRGVLTIPSKIWEEMHEHMDRLDMPVNKFINIAIKRYVKELYREQEATRTSIAFSEMQLSPSTFKPNPNWWYHLDDKQGS